MTFRLIGCHLQPTLGSDGKKKESESNVLLASIENMHYAVTVDVLHTVRVDFFCIKFKCYLLGRQPAKPKHVLD